MEKNHKELAPIGYRCYSQWGVMEFSGTPVWMFGSQKFWKNKLIYDHQNQLSTHSDHKFTHNTSIHLSHCYPQCWARSNMLCRWFAQLTGYSKYRGKLAGSLFCRFFLCPALIQKPAGFLCLSPLSLREMWLNLANRLQYQRDEAVAA